MHHVKAEIFDFDIAKEIISSGVVIKVLGHKQNKGRTHHKSISLFIHET
jgi:hypothetical protein